MWAKVVLLGGFALLLIRACSTDSSPPSQKVQSASSTGSPKETTAPLTGLQPAPSTALAASAAPEKKAELPVKDDLTRIANIEASVREVEQSLTKYYGTKKQLAELFQLGVTAAIIQASYQQDGKTQEHKNLSNKAAALGARIENVSRKVFASTLEEEFIKRGMNINVSATGADQKILRIKYALMSQPLVYKFQNELNLPTIARDRQFQKLIYTNGFDGSLGQTWTVDLKNK